MMKMTTKIRAENHAAALANIFLSGKKLCMKVERRLGFVIKYEIFK